MGSLVVADSSNRSLAEATQFQANKSLAVGDKAWETLLVQANVYEATYRWLQCLIGGHWVDKQSATEVEPDTLDMWYALSDDATDGRTIAGHVELQATAVWDEHKTIGTHARCDADGSVNGLTALGLEASTAENCAQAAGAAGQTSDPATPRKARPGGRVANTPRKERQLCLAFPSMALSKAALVAPRRRGGRS